MNITSPAFPWYPFMTILSFCWGACIGSFLNVCIYRIPREESVVHPGSHCPSCNTSIRWYQNVPIFSWLALRGRCAYCKKEISPRYIGVELLTGCLFLLAWLKFDVTDGSRLLGLDPVTSLPVVSVYWLVIMGLVLGTFVDFDHMIIPDRVTLGGMILGVLASTVVPALHNQTTWLDGLIQSLIGLSVGFGSLWAVAVLGEFAFKKEAMGFGDVKLMGAIGAFFGWPAVLCTIIVASFAGTFVGVSFILARKKEMQSRIPFGPYLALGALVWMYWGPTLWQAYLDLLMP